MSKPTSDDSLMLEIDIDAPPERVFRALTEPKELIAWWGEEAESHTTSWELDLRVGGQWRSRGADKSCGAWTIWGEIIELDPPRLLAYTWHEQVEYRASVRDSVVCYELSATPTGTHLKLTHSGFGAHRAALDSYRGGWPEVLGLLQRYFAKQYA